MLTKNQIKHIVQLKAKKYRYEYKEFVIEGEKCVEDLLGSSFAVVNIIALKEWIDANKQLLHGKENILLEADDDELKKVSSFDAPNKVLAVVKIPDETKISENIFFDILPVIDDIKDPGNLGMIIRSADWFGIKNIICSEQCVDAYNAKVVQASMGAVLRVNLIYTELVKFIKNLPADITVYGSSTGGDSIHGKTLAAKSIVIIGNESRGISKEIKSFVNESLMIPAYNSAADKNAHVESLNAAMASSILFYEFRRGRLGRI